MDLYSFRLKGYRTVEPLPRLCGRHIILHTNLDYIFQARTEGNVLHLDNI